MNKKDPSEESVPEMLARVAAEEEAHADEVRPHYRSRVARYQCPECHKVLDRDYDTPTAPGWCEETSKDVLLERLPDGTQ